MNTWLPLASLLTFRLCAGLSWTDALYGDYIKALRRKAFRFFRANRFTQTVGSFLFSRKGSRTYRVPKRKHRVAFSEAIKGLNQKDQALVTALYLLTAVHKRRSGLDRWFPGPWGALLSIQTSFGDFQ